MKRDPWRSTDEPSPRSGDTGRKAGPPADPAPSVWRTWLVCVGIGLTVFGLVMALVSGTPLFEPVNRLIDPAFWEAGPPDPGSANFQAWAYGAWGATLAGWGVVVTFTAREAFRRPERWAWWALALGTGSWFVLDTGISIAHGVGFNVAVNCLVLVLVALPLFGTRSAAARRRPSDPRTSTR